MMGEWYDLKTLYYFGGHKNSMIWKLDNISEATKNIMTKTLYHILEGMQIV